jgi:haloacetate dehalogenase
VALFEGFTLEHVDVGEATLRVRHAGSGPPLLLLHGHPQTHVMWHKVAPRLAEGFSVVVPDLRGYGESSRPPTTQDHEPYSKRAMARDNVALMRHFGFDTFAVAGHDRGGRCAYRLALDHPHTVTRLAVLDIVPTGEAFRRANREFGLGYWHWFFMAQPFDLPERLLEASKEYYYGRNKDLFDPEAFADYYRCATRPETIHTMCEDYRAGATYDFQLDEQDRGQKKIACPVLALWSGRGALAQWYDVLAIWRDWADQVEGRAIDCGHYLAEEAPDDTFGALNAFLSR